MTDTHEGNFCQDETVRVAAIRSFGLADLIGSAELTRITDFASTLCAAPIALVSIVEGERQWFPVRTGLEVVETPRETSFCAHAMLGADIMVVPDATRDSRFRDNPLVKGEPCIRFYAGAPLVSEDGVQLGALCIIDRAPRAGLSDVQQEGLRVLAANVMALLGARRASRRTDRELEEREAKFRILADAMPQMVWSTRPDGFHDYSTRNGMRSRACQPAPPTGKDGTACSILMTRPGLGPRGDTRSRPASPTKSNIG